MMWTRASLCCLSRCPQVSRLIKSESLVTQIGHQTTFTLSKVAAFQHPQQKPPPPSHLLKPEHPDHWPVPGGQNGCIGYHVALSRSCCPHLPLKLIWVRNIRGCGVTRLTWRKRTGLLWVRHDAEVPSSSEWASVIRDTESRARWRPGCVFRHLAVLVALKICSRELQFSHLTFFFSFYERRSCELGWFCPFIWTRTQ